MGKKKVFAVLAVLMTAFIFYNSAQPAVESAKSSGFLTGIAINVLAYFGLHVDFGILEVILRKTAHVTEFFVQAVFIANSYSGKYRKRIVYVLFFGLLTACCDEYIQLFFDGRGGLISDIFIDFGGTALGTAVCGIFRRRR
ncbi:MAG: VanZ family protein [Clostridia bacterium]|nr:VanZ family protein [Clostridia bacterium]